MLSHLDEPPPYMDGVRINSPHYLCKMIANSGTNVYTLIISQYEKNNTIHYTLRVYATTEFKLTKVANPYVEKYEKRVRRNLKFISKLYRKSLKIKIRC